MFVSVSEIRVNMTLKKISTIVLAMVLVSLLFYSLIFARSTEQGNEATDVCLPIVWEDEVSGIEVDDVYLSKYDLLDQFTYDPAIITSTQVRQITADMNYYDIIDLLGQTVLYGYGYMRLLYIVDGEYSLLIPYLEDWDEPLGVVGEDLLSQLGKGY